VRHRSVGRQIELARILAASTSCRRDVLVEASRSMDGTDRGMAFRPNRCFPRGSRAEDDDDCAVRDMIFARLGPRGKQLCRS